MPMAWATPDLNEGPDHPHRHHPIPLRAGQRDDVLTYRRPRAGEADSADEGGQPGRDCARDWIREGVCVLSSLPLRGPMLVDPARPQSRPRLRQLLRSPARCPRPVPGNRCLTAAVTAANVRG